METRNTEHSKIRQVAKDYEKNGYKVFIEPRGSDIPTFIKNYQPDLIATSDKDNVVVEVKTRTDFATIERLRDIADIINKRENWRFELIVTSSKQENQSESERTNIDLEISEIEKVKKQIALKNPEENLENEEELTITENNSEIEVVEENKVINQILMPSRKTKIKISNEFLSELEKMQVKFKLN